MTTINAQQHIYSNVEKERSPQKKGGFQTLFYSHNGLTENEVEEMESYLLYFPSEVEPVKQLFFTISTGKSVVAQIVFLPKPDQYGRSGRYLAHSLIFAPDELAKFQADPFRVFRQFSFINTVDDALKQGNFKTGDLPAVSLNLPDTLGNEMNAAKKWSAAELKKLTLLALRAPQQANNRDAITLTGQPEQIEQALELAYLAVPVSRRAHCSFDTYFYRCNLVATYFWAIGLPEPPVNIKFAHVDAAAQTVQGEITSHPQTSYERWVLPAIDAGDLDTLTRNKDHALALAEWLDGREYDLSLLNASSNDLITSVFKANPQTVQALLKNKIRKQLPDTLVERAADYVFAQESALDMYRQLRQGFETSQLLEVLYNSYAQQNFDEPARKEIKALEELLTQVDHPMLRLFIAYWKNPKKELPTALERATDADYRQFLETAFSLQLVKPLKLLTPGHADAFLDKYLSKDTDGVALSEALIDIEEFNALPRLNNYAPQLSRKELKKLDGLIEDYPEIPAAFQQAIEQATTALPPERGLKGMVNKILRRSP